MKPLGYTGKDVRRSQDGSSTLWNILTILVLLACLCVGLFVGTIFLNPHYQYNPFPPPTDPGLIPLLTSTPTLPQSPPPTHIPTFTIILTSTNIPSPTLSSTNPLPTETEEITSTPSAGMPFRIIPGDPVAIVNYGHQELGCNWMGVTGRVFDLTGAPIAQGLTVQLGGILDGKPIDKRVLIGVAAPYYGPGAYEIPLADLPIASSKTLWVQLLDQSEIPLSEKIFFDTYGDCEKSLILIDFKQVKDY